jgi:hypothetical protein
MVGNNSSTKMTQLEAELLFEAGKAIIKIRPSIRTDRSSALEIIEEYPKEKIRTYSKVLTIFGLYQDAQELERLYGLLKTLAGKFD